jgi:hypothetical protein
MRHSQQSISGDESCGQAEEAAGQSDAAHACAESLQAEHADDALGQRAAVGGHREDWSAAPFFHQREGARVFDGVPAERDCHIVAAMLTFRTNPFIEPPDCGMIEEQSLDANLEDIYKRIKALDVRQFVGDDNLELFFGESRERSYRQKNDGTKPSDHCRSLQPRALAVTDRARDAELILQPVANLEHSALNHCGLFAAFALQQQESAGGTQAEENDSHKPGFHQPGQGAQR